MNIESEKALPGLEEYSKEFLSDRVGELEEMRHFLNTADLEQVRRMAHKWKGFCAPYGFNYLETLSCSLEKTAEKMDAVKSLELINQISEYLIKKENYLKGSN